MKLSKAVDGYCIFFTADGKSALTLNGYHWILEKLAAALRTHPGQVAGTGRDNGIGNHSCVRQFAQNSEAAGERGREI